MPIGSPESGAVDRLRKAYGDDLPVDEGELRSLVTEYHNERLIIPMQVIDGADLSDLQRLSVLQHQGAATGLLDFTENPLVALWVTCTEELDKDARVFLLDVGESPSRPKRPDVGRSVRCRTSDRVLRTRPFAWSADRCAAERVCDLQPFSASLST